MSEWERPNIEHYTKREGPQPIDVILAWDLDFCLGNILKYSYRAGLKEGNSVVSDLKKVIDYANFELANDQLVYRKETEMNLNKKINWDEIMKWKLSEPMMLVIENIYQIQYDWKNRNGYGFRRILLKNIATIAKNEIEKVEREGATVREPIDISKVSLKNIAPNAVRENLNMAMNKGE